MSPEEAVKWKHGIFGLMDMWGLEPEDIAPPRRQKRRATHDFVSREKNRRLARRLIR
jgi:hypothetical protein